MYDTLIVGQGIAGTLLSYFLLKKGKKIMVMDPGKHDSATNVAAGIINPITGRRYVKSWKVEQLIPFAAETYRALEAELNIDFYQERNIIRTLFNVREENDWGLKTAEPGYEKYMLDEVALEEYATSTVPAFSYGEVTHSAQVNIGLLANAFREKLVEKGAFVVEKFDFDLLKIQEEFVEYKDIKAQQIVFCEGIAVKQNPFFKHLPFGGAKGEVLIVKIDQAIDFSKILKHRVFIAPLGNQHYWIGATYDWDFFDSKPTKEGGTFLEERLKDFLKVPFEIVTHKAAIRPTVKDRRPILGWHTDLKKVAIFNGLGTKGASLGPYWANHMAEFLDGTPLDQAVSISRFES